MKALIRIVSILLILSVSFTGIHAQQTVLIEDFTNASCYYCGQQDPGFYDFINRHSSKVAVISYHTWWPGANDPMYLFNPDPVQYRTTNIYGISGVPTVVVNGNAFEDQPVALTDNLVNNQYARQGTFDIILNEDLNGNTITFDVRVVAHQDYVGAGQVRLFLVLVEKDIYFNTPPGGNGLKEFHYVFRAMLPDKYGKLISPIEAGEVADFHTTYTIDTTVINPDELRTVVFLQNRTTKEVYQTLITPDKSGANGVSICLNPPVIDTVFAIDESSPGAHDGFAGILISGDPSDYQIVWNTNPPQTGLQATNLPAGQYTVTVTDSNGCSTSREVVISTLSTGLSSIQVVQLQLYPNPANDILYIHVPGKWNEPLLVTVKNINGTTVKKFNYTPGATPAMLNLEGLPSGLYLVNLKTGNHSFSEKFMLE